MYVPMQTYAYMCTYTLTVDSYNYEAMSVSMYVV